MTSTPVSHAALQPSDWIVRWSHLIKANGTVLDIACGFGRHVQWFHHRGLLVTGVDRSADALRSSAHLGKMILADIENGPWPLMDEAPGAPQPHQFDAVIVCNYLWRPLFSTILASIKPGGTLLYETFSEGNERYGKPSRPDFLLQPGELLTACNTLKIIAYEDVLLDAPPRCVQRIAAMRPLADTAP